MVLKLVHSWSAAAAAQSPATPLSMPPSIEGADEDDLNLDYDDPEAILSRERKAEKQKHQEEEIVSERRAEQRQTSEKEEHDNEERRLRDWFGSEQYRHAIAELSADIGDARQATFWALSRATAEQQQAREALEAARRDALVVAGDRVYLTRDGSRLYGEDDRQITDTAAIADAQGQQRDRPGATRYEGFVERRNAHDRADETVEKLRAAATRLDELDKRIKKGGLSPEDLAEAGREKQDIIGSLPPEAREKYERLHALRQDPDSLSYRAADPAFAAAPDLSADFQRAGAAAAEHLQPDGPKTAPLTGSKVPAYRSALDF